MRGGHRQRPVASPGSESIPTPRDLDRDARAVFEAIVAEAGPNGLRTLRRSDALFVRLAAQAVVAAERAAADTKMAATARARLIQAAGSMLASLGLSPLSRERIKPVEDTRTPAEKLLASINDE
jgi:hypothetical protein